MKRVQEVDLAVHGFKATVLQGKSSRRDVREKKSNRYQFKQLQIAQEERPTTTDNHGIIRRNSSSYRETFTLNTAKLSGSAVQTKQLKEIRESVEIEDLRRLLRTLGDGAGAAAAGEKGGDVGRGGKVVTSVDCNSIYREFFQVHYDFLRDALDRLS